MREGHSSARIGSESNGPIVHSDTRALKRAVAKVVLLGQQAGVSPDEMITLLDTGMTVSELLEYVIVRVGFDA
jgi:hypothetical protein